QIRKDTQAALRYEGKNIEGNAQPGVFNRLQTDLLFKDSAAALSFKCSSANVDDMLPKWKHGRDGVDHLFFLRKVQSEGITFFQGVAVHWPKLQQVLLEQVKGLLPDATLEPMSEDDDPGNSMTAIPVRLV